MYSVTIVSLGGSVKQPQLLRVTEVAERLDVSVKTVYRLIRQRRLEAVRVGRVWRVPVAWF